MTNTLHRQGTAESLKSDYVVFATTAKGYNREGSGKLLREFLHIAVRHKPVNVRGLDLDETDLAALDKQIDNLPTVGATATFDNIEAVRGMVADLVKADLGISINISGLLEEVAACCRSVGITRHSVEHSLGVRGQVRRLPDNHIMEINTMCGHGLVSFNLIKKVIDYIKMGRLTPEQGAKYLAKPCVCGAFNTTRAAQFLAKMRDLG